MKQTIDAQGKRIGRIASQAAVLLMGKHKTLFAKNVVDTTTVEIVNAASLLITAKKRTSDTHVTYTGHRGGLNTETLGELIKRRGMNEVLRRAIYGMLPNNKLRDRRMKNLVIKD